ncbi:MAG: LamG-like jellyroll fold domain-containing protein [Terrimicrobiaceae bacterium]
MKRITEAFTLLEMLVVTLVIGVLAGVAVPKYQQFVVDARKGRCLTNLKSIEQSISVWETKNQRLFPGKRYRLRFQPTDGLIWGEYPTTGSSRRPSGRDVADIIGDSIAFVCSDVSQRYGSQANVPVATTTAYFWLQRAGANDFYTETGNWEHLDDFGDGETRNAICPAFGRPGRGVPAEVYSSLPVGNSGISSSQLTYLPFYGPDYTRKTLHYDRKLAATSSWYIVASITSPNGILDDPFLLFPKGVQLTITPDIKDNLQGLNPQVTDILANGNIILTGASTQWTPSAPGEYVLAARAKDSSGNIRVSSPVRVRIPPPPVVTMNSFANNPTNLNPIPVTVTFNVDVTGFVAADITTVGATVGSFTQVTPALYTFNLIPTANVECDISADIAAGAAQDGIGSLNAVARQFLRQFRPVPPWITISSPTVPLAADPAIPLTATGPVQYTITYNKADSVFLRMEDIIPESSGTAVVQVIENPAGTGTGPFVITMRSIVGDGKLGFHVAGGTASDTAGNIATVSVSSERFTVDNTRPTGAFTYTGNARTNTNPILVTIAFSENIYGFSTASMDITNASASPADVWVDPDDSYRVYITPVASQCYISLNFNSDRVRDAAGNKNAPAPPLSFTYDKVKPSVLLSSTATNPTNLSPIPIRARFDEDVVNFQNNFVSAENGAVSNVVELVNMREWTFDVTPDTSSGVIRVSLGEGAVKDLAGNDNNQATKLERNYYRVFPKVVLDNLPAALTWFQDAEVTVKPFDVNNEPISEYQWKRNETSWSSWISVITTIKFVGLAEGAQILMVVGRTPYGIEQSKDDPTTWNWVVDKTPPRIASVTTSWNPTNVSPIVVTASFTERVIILATDASLLYCNEAAITNFTGTGSVYTFNIVPTDINADKVFTVTFKEGMAKDGAGNPSESYNGFSVTYDKTPPMAIFTTKPEAQTFDRLAVFGVGGTDVIQYKYKLDSGTWSSGPVNVADPFVLNYLTVGTHTVYLIGRDSVGNWQASDSLTLASYSWLVKPAYISPVAGTGISSFMDGKWYTSKFNSPRGVTKVGDKLYVGDRGIRSLSLSNGMVTSARPDIVRDGLVLNLDASDGGSYPGYSIIWSDLSGYANHGTLVNGVGYDANSGSVVFDGGNDYVSIKTSSSLNPGSLGFSISTWFKMNSAGGLNGSILYNKENLYEASAGGGYFTYAWQPHWAWDGDTSFPVSVGTWYNATVVYDKSKQYMYKNGVLVYSRAQTGDMGANSIDLGIGARGLPSASAFFGGNISNTTIYNRDLSASEVLQNYNASPLSSLNLPVVYGLTSDGTGNLYSASVDSHIIRQLNQSTQVTTILAGKDGTAGFFDGIGINAIFNAPRALAYYGGFLYVADTNNHIIRAVNIAGGAVSTLAGVPGTPGSLDGGGAKFNAPYGITVDSVGNLYVTDTGNHTIRKINASTREVTTIAGSAGQSGYADGIGTSARFNSPYGIAVDSIGNLMVTDYGNKLIRKISAAGVVSTVAGSPGSSGNAYGVGGDARFQGPYFITSEDDSGYFISDFENYTIKKLTFFPYAILRNTPAVLTNQITIGATVDGGGLTGYKYKLDGGAISGEVAMGVPITLGVPGTPPDGAHTVSVWGKGIADDWQPLSKPTVFTWNVDTIPPMAVLSNLPSNPTYDTVTSIRVAGQVEPVACYRYKIDTQSWTASISSAIPIALSSLSPGTHTILVVGQDAAGNWQADANATSFAWLVRPVYVSLIAGVGTPGLLDGKWYNAKFMSPRGLAKLGSNLHVADNGIRTVGLFSGLVGTPRPEMVKEGLVLSLDADNGASYPGNGAIWYDLSGNANHATLGSAIVTSTPSYLNSGGTSQVPINSILNNDTHSIFFALQFNPTTAYPTGYTGAWNKIFGYEPSGSDRSPGVWRYPSQRYLHWRYDPGNNGIDFGKNPANQDFDLNTWYIVGVTKDGATAKAYVNGQEMKTMALPNPKQPGNSPIYLFSGYPVDMSRMAFCQIYNRALTPSEVLQNYNATPLSQLSLPVAYGLTSDGSENLFSTSIDSHIIKKVNQTTQTTSVLAGKDGVAGFFDGAGNTAMFSSPRSLAYYAGFLYVADTNNQMIRAVNVAGGAVSTLAGAAGSTGSQDGAATVARFRTPYGITVDPSGNLYVADTGNHTIRKIAYITHEVTTIAGSAGQSGYADGIGAAARFNSPYGVAADSVGNILVTDYGNKVIRKISATGVVTTIAGGAGLAGNAAGIGADARFQGPHYITCEDDGGYFISDFENYTVKKLTFLPYAVLRNTPDVLTNAVTGSIAVDGGGLLGYKYSLDGAPISGDRVMGSPIAFTLSGTPPDGVHTISVWGKGIADDWQPATAPTVFTWTVDTKAPVVVLSNLPPNGYRDTFCLITVAAAAGDEAESYQYSLDGGTTWSLIAPIEKPISLTDLQPGTHNILVRGKDLAGNLQTNSALYASYTWSIAPTYINTLAGGNLGLVDGRLYDAKFSDPMGAFRSGSSVYVGDRANNILRKIALDTSNVSSIDPGKYALQFNGLTNYLSIPHSASFDSNSVTVELWFTLKGDPNTDGNNNWRSLIRMGSTSGAGSGWDVVLEEGLSVAWDIGLSGAGSRMWAPVGIKLNEPIHMAFVYDSTTGNQLVYANGLQVGTTKTNTAGTVLTRNTEPIIVAGGTNTGNFPNGSGYTPGKYCNIRIWNTARTAAEVLAYYRGGLPANPAGLVGSYKCSEGLGVTVGDDSGSSPAGTLVLSPQWVTTDVPVALLSGPHGVTTYDLGAGEGPMIYVADFYNNVIRKVNPTTLETTVFAGRLGSPGSVDGIGGIARFYNPIGIVAFSGNLYVSDWSHHSIRMIHIADGAVTTIAGSTSPGSVDGNGTTARFYNPAGIALDSTGANLYVADYSNHTVRKIDFLSRNVTTFAGAAGIVGSNSGCSPTLARFNQPMGLGFDAGSGRLFISEYGNHDIRMINLPANLAMTVAGKAGEPGYSDGTGGFARFRNPTLVTTNTGGNDGVIIGERGNNALRIVTFEPLAMFRNVPPPKSNLRVVDVSVVGAGLTGYRYKFDADAAWTEILTGSPIHKDTLVEGEHTLQVIGKGALGEWQQDANATTMKWTVDTTPPIVALSNLPTNPTYDLVADMGVAGAVEAVVRYKYKLDSLDWTASISYTIPIALRDLAPGTHTILVVGQDEAGNWQTEGTATAYTWLVKPIYVTTLAGEGTANLQDGKWYDAKMSYPVGVAKSGDTLYISDFSNKAVRSVSLTSGVVKTVAGSPLGGAVLSFDGSDDFAQAPSGEYFTGDFTVMAWVYVRNFNSWSRLIDFGNGPNSDNILFAISNGTTGQPNLHVFNGGSNSNFTAPSPISLNQWVHLAATLQGTSAKIYVNGALVASANLNTPRNIVRNRCYIGRSNWGESLANAFMSDLSIWSVARSIDDIQADMNSRLLGNESGLVAYWPMADQQNTLVDLTSSRRDATLYGTPLWMENAGPPIISGDGVGAAARFKNPSGMAMGQDGKLYVADYGEHTIRKIDPATRLTTTYAGGRNLAALTDGTGLAARFNGPFGVTAYDNYLFVAENGNCIRRIDLSNAKVTLFAGSNTAGSVDGAATVARFGALRGIAQSNGILYVPDYGNHTIRKIDIGTGIVTTLAGSAGVVGASDGIGAQARFNGPCGIEVDSDGNLFVTEWSGQVVRKVSPAGNDTWRVTTIAGKSGVVGKLDGLGVDARFRNPYMMARDGAFGFFFADSTNNQIRKLSLQPWVALANTPNLITNDTSLNISVRGGGLTAYSYKIDSDAWSAEKSPGTNIFVSGILEGSHTVLVKGKGQIGDWQPDAGVTTFIWNIDLTPPVATLTNLPAISTLDDMTNIQVGGVDVVKYKYLLQKMANGLFPAGAYSSERAVATPLALTDLAPGTYTLSVIGCDTAGNWQSQSSPTQHSWFVKPVYVTTVAGNSAYSLVNGQWFNASFRYIISVAVGKDGSVYMCDYYNNCIRKMDPDGMVTTLAGPTNQAVGYRDGPGEEVLFYNPHSITLSDDSAYLYVGDYSNQVIRKVDTKTGYTTTFAGTPNAAGNRNGAGNQALFYSPAGVTVWNGFLYVTNVSSQIISRIDLNTAQVSTLAGAWAAGFVDGDGTAARFYNPYFGDAADGFLYNSDYPSHAIRKTDLATAKVTTLAGIGIPGRNDGPPTVATFYNPYGVTVGSEYVYVADCSNHSIRRIDKITGNVAVLAGSKVAAAGNTDDVGNKATFYNPYGIWTAADGSIFVTNWAYHNVKKITFTPWVALANTPLPRTNQTFANISVRGGGVQSYKYKLDTPVASGSWSASDFGMSVTIVRSDLTDEGRYMLSVIGQGAVGEWQSTDSPSTYTWYVDRTPPVAVLSNKPSNPYWGSGAFITVSGDDVKQYQYTHDRPVGFVPASGTYDVKVPIQLAELEPGWHTIEVMGIDTAGNKQLPGTIYTFLVKPLYVSTVAGEGSSGTGDGKWYEAQFTEPTDLCIALNGDLLVADGSSQRVRRIALDTGMVTTLYQSVPNQAAAIDRDKDGNLFVACGEANTNVLRISSSGALLGTITGFNGPTGIVYDNFNSRDQLYVMEHAAKRLRRVFSGTWASENVQTTGLLGPRGIVVASASGNILSAGYDSHHIMWVAATTGVVSLLAGRENYSGATDDIATAARFLYPSDVAIADGGTIYIADSGNKAIRRLVPGGQVTTYTGSKGKVGDNETTADAARFTNPLAVVTVGEDLFVVDQGTRKIKRISPYPWATLRDTPPTRTAASSTNIIVGGGGVTGYKYQLERTGSPTAVVPWTAEIASGINIQLAALVNGTYTLTVNGKGVASPTADWQIPAASATTFVWQVDSTMIEPNVILLNKPASPTYSLTTDIIATGAAVVSYVYRIDGGGWSNVTNVANPIIYQGLAPGEHTIQVKGIDEFGNRQGVSTDWTWTILPTYVTTVAGSVPGYIDDKWYSARMYEPMGLALNGSNELIFVDRVNRAVRKLNLLTGITSPVVDSKWSVLSLDGVDDRIDLGNPANLHTLVDQTIELWIRPGAWNTANGYQILFFKHYMYEGMLALYMNGQLIYWYGTGSTYGGWWGLSGGVISPGVWSHIALVRDLTTSMQIRFYVNGNLQTTVGAPYTSAGSYEAPFYMFYGWNPNFKGEVADMRLWSTARTTQQIASGMSMLLTGTEPGLKGYWPLFDGSGNTVLDMTPNRNPGTLYGNPTWSDVAPPFTTQSGGMGSSVNLGAPYGLVIATGCAYFTDYNRHVIYKTDLTNKLTTVLAGTENQDGATDGTGPVARFRNPAGLAFDGTDLFVADYGNHTIRKVTFAGVVTTPVGVAGSLGTTNGTGDAARFNYPIGIAADRAGSLLVADSGNRIIRKIDIAQKIVTTLAGSGIAGRIDGASSTARFNQPVGIAAIEPAGRVLVADGVGQTIRMIDTDASGSVVTVAGVYGTAGKIDGNGDKARFSQPFYIGNAETDSFYVGDRTNNLIRKFSFKPRVALTNTPPLLTGKNLDIEVQGGGVTSYKYRIDGGALSGEQLTSARINRDDVSDGAHTLKVIGKGFGNEWQDEAVAEQFQWSVDTTPPTVVLENTPSNPTLARVARITATGTDVIQYRYSLDGGAYSDPTYPSVPIRLDNLDYGTHSLNVIGIDTAGNWQTAPTNYTWVVKPLYVSLVAGKAGSSGLTNGKWYDAEFMEPSGLVKDAASNLYVVGGGNQTLRRFKTDAMQVENFWPDNNISPLFPEESLEFDGLNDYVSVPHNTAFNSSSVTVEMWFTLTSDPNTDANANWRSLIRKGSTSSTPTGWDVVIEDDKTLTWDVGLGASSRLLNVNVGLTVGNPIHLAFVYDANTGNQYVYANGVQKGSKTNSATGIVGNTEAVLFAQGTNEGKFPNGSGYTPGRFANVRLWNTPRTPEQITSNMSRQLLGNETGLVGYWPLAIINGLITRDIWLGIAGGSCTDLTGNARFPDSPDTRDQLSAFDVPQSSPTNVENFGTRIYGWINPPQTGTYNFYMCTDDGGKLFLSTDGTPTNKRQICGETWAWGYKNWFASTVQKSGNIDLVAGQLYFIEGIQKEGGGGDHIVVGWTGPGMSGTPQVISGSSFSTYAFRDLTSSGSHGTLKYGPSWVNGITYRRFDTHGGVVRDGNILYLAARDTHTIRRVDLTTGQATVLAGVANQIGASDGDASTARFNMPTSLTKVGDYLYVTDFGNHTVRKVHFASGLTTTLAGQVGTRGWVDSSTSTEVRFSGPYGITTDGTYLYVTDAHNHVIRRMAQDGSTTTYAGQGKLLGNVDGDLLSESRFFYPTGIQRDGSFLYVVNEGNHTLRRVDMVRSVVTTVAGKSGIAGNLEGVGVNATFNTPHYVTPVEGEAGAFFLSDNHTIRKIAPYPVATLKNIPDDPTNNTSVGIVVYGGGVDEYKYKVVRGSTLISDWSAWQARSAPISLTTDTAGQYTVTVLGRNTTYGDEQPAAYPTIFSWSKSANMALGQSVSQSSDYSAQGVAAKAVDGNKNGLWANGSITHTNSDAQAWWQVDLGSVKNISKVRLWNSENVPSRLTNLYVLVSDTAFSSTNLQATIDQAGVESYYFPGTIGLPTEFAVERTGRYVRVQLVGTNYLTLAEVEVMEGVPKNITSFSFNELSPAVTGLVNEKAKTINLLVPIGTNITALTPTITHTGASISPSSGVMQNFTAPVTYTVKDLDGSTRAYVVYVDSVVRDGLVLHLDAAKSTSYAGAGATTWYDLSGNNNNATLANGPTYSSANGGSIKFDGTNDYAQTPVTGIFPAFSICFWGFFDDAALNTTLRDESAFGDWTSGNLHFGTRWSVGMHYNVNSVWTSAIPNTNLVYGWNHYALVYDTITNRKLIYINNILSWSNVTNGSVTIGNLKIGVATALDKYYRGNISSFQIYNRALSPSEISLNYNSLKPRYIEAAKAVTEFKFASPLVTGVINEASKTIALTVPYGTNLTALVPTIRHTGASVLPNTGIAQDFTNPVTYTVKAVDGSTQAYVVTVDNIIRDSLILQLDAGKSTSYPGSGNTWTDLSGNGNSMTISGATFVGAGPNHFSFTDNAVNQIYKSSFQSFSGVTNSTISLWVRFDNLSVTQSLLSYAVTGMDNELLLFLNPGTPPTIDQTWSGTAQTGSYSGLTTNTWNNIVITRNGTSDTHYLNGVQVGLKSSVGSSLRGGGTLIFGQEQDSVGGTFDPGQDFPGDLSAVQIYNRALSGSEVLLNYNALKPRYTLDAKAVVEFDFAGLAPTVIGSVNESTRRINLTVPGGTNVTALVPTIRYTGASISPNTGVAQDFTNPVTYTVTAPDTSAQQYTVTVNPGASAVTPAISAAEIKASDPTVKSGVYWLKSSGINGGTPFQCYCDFTMDGGIGYAIYFQQYFDSADDGGNVGFEYGPTFASMTSTGITGTAGYGSEFNVYPNLMPIQYNNGAGATRMIVFNRTNTGTSDNGIQGATNYKWLKVTGLTPENMRAVWASTPSRGAYTVSYTAVGNSGRTSGSGIGYILGSHAPGAGVHQWVSGDSANANTNLIFEYKPFAATDPNHFWMIDTGEAASVYFRSNGEYGTAGVFNIRWGGIAIY